MNYSAAIKYLYDLQMFGMKPGLESTLKLAALAGNPQDKLRFIHVAGTNGKGSTCAMLENIYRQAGLRVGLFTSPHLVSFTERIQVNRQPIGQDDAARLAASLSTLHSSPSTFFEFVAVMALKYFAEQNCDLVIWETGMGGRLDATNIVTPLACVITNVQWDHQKWLGNTLAKIAEEKAGIIKPSIPVITGTREPSALAVISKTAAENSAPLTIVASPETQYKIALPGEHQKWNAALTVATVRVLAGQIPVTEENIRTGLKTVQWAGRFQIIQRGLQSFVLDGAHNPDGAKTLVAAVRDHFPGQTLVLILGMLQDKDCAEMCRILAPLAAKIFLSPVGSDRTAQTQELVEYCRTANPAAETFVCQNIAEALAKTAQEPLVVAAGSLYFIGEVMDAMKLAPSSNERGLNEYTLKSAN